jgi:hypothetical protein
VPTAHGRCSRTRPRYSHQEGVSALVCKLLLLALQRLKVLPDIVHPQGRVGIYPYGFLGPVEVRKCCYVDTNRPPRERRLLVGYFTVYFTALLLQWPGRNLLYKEDQQLILSDCITTVILLPLTKRL